MIATATRPDITIPTVVFDSPNPKLDPRQRRGLELAHHARITATADGWEVWSLNGANCYQVRTNPAPYCECVDFAQRHLPCLHVYAARFVEDRQRTGRMPTLESMGAAPKRPTYTQNWKSYDLAQSTEKDRFLELLYELAKPYRHPHDESRVGRPRKPLEDALFAAVFKVY